MPTVDNKFILGWDLWTWDPAGRREPFLHEDPSNNLPRHRSDWESQKHNPLHGNWTDLLHRPSAVLTAPPSPPDKGRAGWNRAVLTPSVKTQGNTACEEAPAGERPCVPKNPSYYLLTLWAVSEHSIHVTPFKTHRCHGRESQYRKRFSRMERESRVSSCETKPNQNMRTQKIA